MIDRARPMTEHEQRMAEFVNRDEHLGTFSKLLVSDKKMVMSLAGESGMGKSWLVERMIHECSLQSVKTVYISYVGDGVHDYIAVMRQCRDALDAKLFDGFTDLLNYYTVPRYELKVEGSIAVAENARFQNSPTGVMAGVYVRDLYLPELRTDLNIPEAERREALSAKFIAGLKQIGVHVVIFVDGIERMAAQTQEWLWGKLVGGVVNERLTNFRFVISGQVECKPDHPRKPLVMFSALEPLKRSDVAEYLSRRGIRPEEVDHTAQTLMRLYKGKPFAIAVAADEILRAYEEEDERGNL